jgi:hypothetical protein
VEKRKPSAVKKGCGSKKRRATAAAAAAGPVSASSGGGGSSIQRNLLYGRTPKDQDQRIRLYADVALKLMPKVPSPQLNAWVHIMEHAWSIIQQSPGFKYNSSQLHPPHFALVCLNYMRTIGLKLPVGGCDGNSQIVCVLPCQEYIRDNMPDIKLINKKQFAPAERALMCCISEMPRNMKMKLAVDDKALESLYFSYFLWFSASCFSDDVATHLFNEFNVRFGPQNARQIVPKSAQCRRRSPTLDEKRAQISQDSAALLFGCTRPKR